MSALGQKQTYAPQKRVSALPPIATAKADFRARSEVFGRAKIGDEVNPAQGLINNFTVASAYDAGANSIHSWIGFDRL